MSVCDHASHTELPAVFQLNYLLVISTSGGDSSQPSCHVFVHVLCCCREMPLKGETICCLFRCLHTSQNLRAKRQKSMHAHLALMINNRGCCMGCGLNEGMRWGDIQVAIIRPGPAAVSPVPSLRLPLLSTGFFSPVLMTYKLRYL